MNIYRRVLRSLVPFWPRILLAALLLLLTIAASLLLPWPMKVLIDNVFGDKPFAGPLQAMATRVGGDKGTLLAAACVVFCAIEVFRAVCKALHQFVIDKVGLELVHGLRTKLYDHLQRLSLGYHKRTSIGDSIYRVIVETNSLNMILNGGLLPMITSAGMLVGIFAIMIGLDPVLALVSLAVVPPIFWLIHWFSPRIKRRSQVKLERESQATATVEEGISAIKAIIAFGREDEKVGEFHRRSAEVLVAGVKVNVTKALFSLLVAIAIALGTAVVLWVGGRHVLEGTLTIGGITVFISYLAQLYNPIHTLSQIAETMQGSAASAERVFEVIDSMDEVQEAADAAPISGVSGSVEFRNVSFAYEPDRPVLEDISFRAAAGETIAIVGPTGVGKSTLVSLIPRFYDPVSGQILIDGLDTRKARLADLRSQVTMVLQEMTLFSSSIKENIRFGRPDATFEEIVEAGKSAGAHEFISSLPDGYDTLVGERGARLSHGQQQRITIARAFLRDAPIMIMDEPTASLDPTAESIIVQSLTRLTFGRTVFVIAHRLSTIRDADRVLVMDQGRIAEEGTHEELIKKAGLYKRFYDFQLLLATMSEDPLGS